MSGIKANLLIPNNGYNNIILNRLCREFVKKGYYDLKIICQNEYIYTNKMFFCYFNDYFNCLINDEKFDGSIELYKDCSKESFYALECYYSGGTVLINNSNCVDILNICEHYNEIRLLNITKKYIIEKNNLNVAYKLLSNEYLCNCENLKDLYDVIKLSIKYSGIELLNNESIIILFRYINMS